MRRILLILTTMTSCAIGDNITPDAAIELLNHDLVSTCDKRWGADGRPPAACERACERMPAAPEIQGPPKTCDTTRPCLDLALPCERALAIVGPPISCPSTFTVEGVRGCCAIRTVETYPPQFIPSFYECQYR